eukprot:143239-Rhodomonas_salina.3
MSGTDLGGQVEEEEVLDDDEDLLLGTWESCAMSGTDPVHSATTRCKSPMPCQNTVLLLGVRVLCCVRYWPVHLRACYAMSSTAIAYGAICRCACRY